MVLFGAFVIFLCTKKKEEKKLFQNDLNECIFVYVHGEKKKAIQKCEQSRDVFSAGKGGES